MTSYATQRGERTGATIWRAVADGPVARIAPDGVMDLLWFRDRLVVAGPDTRTAYEATRPGDETWGLQLPPGVAHALFGRSASELTDRRVDLADLVAVPDHEPSRFHDDPADALERVYVALWTRADPDRDMLRVAASLDRAARDGTSVADTAARHGLSPRSLQRLSNRLFGYGPKTLMRIHRLQHGLRLVTDGRPASAAAAMAGYADQSHFIREARELAGRTPLDLVRSAGEAVRFVQS